MLIRKATIEDTDALLPLYQGSLAHMAFLQPRQFRAAPQDVSFVQKGIVEESGDIFVAEEAGEIIGLAAVFYEEIAPRAHRAALNYADLDTLFVSEYHRGKGVGTALFRAVQAWARERKAQSLQLITLGENDYARRFYEKMGMQELMIRYIKEEL